MGLYNLTSRQLKVLEVMTNPDYYLKTQDEKAQAAGVSLRMLQYTVRLDKYKEALESLRKDILSRSLTPLIRKAFKEAMADSFQDRQMLLKIGGVLVEKSQVDLSVDYEVAFIPKRAETEIEEPTDCKAS